MTTYFIDTSALFKRYMSEQGSSRMDEVFAEGSPLFVSSLTVVELRSNLQRLRSVDRVIDDMQFRRAWAAFSLDLATGRLQAVGVSAEIVDATSELLITTYITPIDALLIATAESLGTGVITVSSDQRLNQLVAEASMRFLDPTARN